MQLLFIWIEDFYSIKNQNFNFGFEYKFEYDQKANVINPLEQNYTIPSSFFGDNILNASAIVGENGAGKTTLINYIYSFLGNFYSKAVFLIKLNDQYILYHHKDFEGIEIVGEDQMSIKIKKLPYDSVIPKFESEKLQVIYSSNAFSVKKFWKTKASAIDLSTTSLVETYKSIDLYKINELKKQVNFINNKPSEFKIDFEERLKSIEVFFDNIDIQYIVKAASKLNILHNFSKHIVEDADKPGWRKMNNPWLIPYLLNVALIPTALNILKGKRTDIQYLGLLEVPPLILNDTPDQDFLRSIIKFLKILRNDAKSLDNENKERLMAIYRFLVFVIWDIRLHSSSYQLYIKKNLDYVSIDIIDFHFEIASSRFNDFEMQLDKLKLEEKIINFNWNLSSGENAYLAIYSRLFDYAQRNNLIKDSIEPKQQNYIWLILDEVELYMHPQWQKEFVKKISEFVSHTFAKVQVQIFLTSHSPLVIGDFPKNNIAFIKREDGLTKVSNIEHEETFGANIFNLFTDSFFIKDGLTGDFASEKIDLVLKLTTTDESIENNLEYINAVTKFIGEPILKDHIEKRIEYFSFDEEDLKREYDKIGNILNRKKKG